MSEQVYLGVDLGAESGRVMAGRWDGRSMQVEELHRFPNGPVSVGGTLRWDVLRLWTEIRHGLGLAASRFGNRVVSVGVDAWGVDWVLLSRSGELLGMPYHYRDSRTRGVMDGVVQKWSREAIFGATGVQFMPINTLYQWLAMARDHPDVMEAAGRLLMIPDFFHWCLCGSKSVEFTNATTTQFHDPVRRDWARGLLGQLQLSDRILGEVVEPGTRLGTLLPDVASDTGLGPIPVIAPATHDTGSAVAAVPADGVGDARWAYISSGTWSLVGIESLTPMLTPRALELNVTNEGGVDRTWRVLKNVTGLWLVQQCRRSFERDGNVRDYAVLTRLAAEARPGGPVIDPDDPRFLNPPDMPEAIRSFCRETNQREPQGEGELIRCVLESLARKYAEVLQGMESLSGRRVDVVHIVGGGSKNGLLNQLTAGATGRPVMAGPVEATVLGNLLTQARACGEVGSLAEMRRLIRASNALEVWQPEGAAASGF